MARSIVLSNGMLCVALDEYALVRDIYYPHVGQEDHVRGHYIHRVGVWVDGRISWLGEDHEWQIEIGCEEEALASRIIARHGGLGVELVFTDIVYNEEPIFVRRVEVKNTTDNKRTIKVYFGHQFEIFKAHGGDTAYFDPEHHAVIHYKGKRVFLIAAEIDGVSFDDYTIGITGFDGKEGSHRDADDGVLSKNPIEHGPVDSIIGLSGEYTYGAHHTIYYRVVAAQYIAEVHDLDAVAVAKTPAHLVQSASDYWRAWVNSYGWKFEGLSNEHVALFKRSLMYVRAHVDKDGGILASLDSDMLRYKLDTYAYIWPRDAAYAALALDRAGDTNVAKRFFEFCRSVISKDGYFMHKYWADGSLGSSWHPWIRDGQRQLPIQEDETALVIIAFAEHYKHSRDLEFLEEMFNPLVAKAADFMLAYRDPHTKLPLASYDLWEEKHGCSTFTASCVYGALMLAAELSDVLGKKEHSSRYRTAAQEIQSAIITHLWDEASGTFIKQISYIEGKIVRDTTLDTSSVYGVFSFGVLTIDDLRLTRAWEATARRLSQGIAIGGIARYEGDNYFRADTSAAGNPWVITTLWYAEYLIARARTESDFDRVREIFNWVARHAPHSGVLPEQFNSQTGMALSATPLAWSHAAYVSVVIAYLDRREKLGLCVDCNPVP